MKMIYNIKRILELNGFIALIAMIAIPIGLITWFFHPDGWMLSAIALPVLMLNIIIYGIINGILDAIFEKVGLDPKDFSNAVRKIDYLIEQIEK